MERADFYKGRSGKFIKGFLLNDKRNKNGWRVTWEAIKKYHADFIGKPATYRLNNGEQDHPEGRTFKMMMTNQENYRVGNIIDVLLDEENRTLNYVAEILPDELTQTDFEEIYDRDEINDTSPGIFPTDFKNLGGTMPNGEPIMDIYAFRALHIAYVTNPAYREAAHTIGKCQGLGDTCMKRLVASEVPTNNEIILIQNKINKLWKPCEMPEVKKEILKAKTNLGDRLRAIEEAKPDMPMDVQLAIAYAFSQEEGRQALQADLSSGNELIVS